MTICWICNRPSRTGTGQKEGDSRQVQVPGNKDMMI